LTVGYNVVEGVMSIVAALWAGSTALASCGKLVSVVCGGSVRI